MKVSVMRKVGMAIKVSITRAIRRLPGNGGVNADQQQRQQGAGAPGSLCSVASSADLQRVDKGADKAA